MSKPMNICMDCVNNFFDKKKNRYFCADNKTRIEDVPCDFFEQRCVDDIDNPWHEGKIPARTEGWFLVKYQGIYGLAIGRTEYRAVHQYCVDGYMWFYDGHINADDIWKPIKYKVIEEEK